MNFEVIILPTALQDVQDAVDYYDEQSIGLGEKFESELNEFLIALEHNPFFQNRYETVRCLPVEEIPVHGAFLCLGREESGGRSCRISYFVES